MSDLFLFCYELDFLFNLRTKTQSSITDAFDNTSRYFHDIFKDIYPLAFTFNKAKTDDENVSFSS